MWHPESKHHGVMRRGLGHGVFGRWAALLLLGGLLGLPGLSRAACTAYTPPNASATSPMPAGGTITMDVNACSASPGFGINGITTPAGHGTATVTSHAGALIEYSNNGDGVTTDTFQYDDGSGSNNVTVTVHIAPAGVPAPPVAGASVATVGYGSTSNPITLNLSGGAATAVAVGTQATHGTAAASGTTITYTPAAGYAGPDSFTYTASNAGGSSAPATVTITVSPPSIAYAPGNPPAATAGAAYSQSLASASGGMPPYSYTIVSGNLPAGLTLTSNGTLSGTPTEGGSFNFAVRATDSSTGAGAPFSATSGTLPLLVNPAAIAVSPSTLTAPTVGTAYARTVIASGGVAPYSFAISAGVLPPGLSLNPASGAIGGTPTGAGNYSFTVTATDSSGGSGPYTGSRGYAVAVAAPALALTPASGTTFNSVVGASASGSFTASGGTGPYSYTIDAGALPAGVTLSPGGSLSGAPTATGSFSFTVKATDSSTGTGAPFSTSANYTMLVAVPTITLSPASLPAPVVGNAYSQTIVATEGRPTTFTYAVTSGSLPNGLSLAAASGLLSGTPTAAGSFSFTVTATDGDGFTGSHGYSLTVAAGTVVLPPGALTNGTAGAAYSHSFVATGGTPGYTYAISAGSLPAGLSLSAGGVLGGTPTVAGSFNFTVKATDSSTGAGAPFSASQAYVVTIAAPTITLAPATLPGGKVAVAYQQTLSASGGTGGYSYGVSSGQLPPGLNLSGAGVLGGTPTVAGNFNFTVTATDGNGFGGSQAYTVGIGQATPVALGDTASTPANAPVSIAVTANDSGPIASIALAQAPAHGTAAVHGLDVQYTPAANYFGSDSFTYTATGPGGSSAPATVTLSVTALAVPVAAAQSVTVLGGKSVTIHAAQGASGAPYTRAAIVAPPAVGTAAVSGNDIVYSAPADATGTVSFDYTLSNAFGTSAPARISVTVNPLPQAVALSASVLAGRTVQVDLTRAARGGPFTDAAVVTVAPAAAGSASIRRTASGYALDFAASDNYDGQAKVGYTLSNAYATSAVASVTVTVTGRSDPSRDAEVRGVLGAQVDSVRRLALGQINNFQRRLETLHAGPADAGFSNGISFSSAGAQRQREELQQPWRDADWANRYLAQPEPPAPAPAATVGRRGGWSLWSGGAVNFGKAQAGSSHDGIDFATQGISLGADRAFGDALALGLGVGYGHDASDIGRHGSRSTVDSYSAALYGSYRPAARVYLDALAGYQRLSLDARRYVTDDGSMVHGRRDGAQWFASLALGYELDDRDGMRWSPYGRYDMARASLDGYTERGSDTYALHYQRQTVTTSTGVLGLRAQWAVKRDYGVWLPQLRAEFRHDFQGASVAAMRYADLLGGHLYEARLGSSLRNHTLLGVGVMLKTLRGLSLRAEYQNLLDNATRDNHTLQLMVEKRFGP